MMKHTPGPWEVVGTDTGIDVMADQRHICTMGIAVDYIENARLIAATPELLALLKSIDPTRYLTRQEFQNITAAIAKAEGREIR